MVERRAERLAREAAEMAAKLARDDSEKAITLAVERAVKDRDIEHRLGDHDRHFTEINGSQKQMAASLEKVEQGMGQLAESWGKQAAVNQALSDEVTTRQRKGFSLWMVIAAVVAAIGAYSGLIVAAIAH